MQNYTYTKLIYGLELSLQIVEAKIKKARKNGEDSTSLKIEFDNLTSDQMRFLVASKVHGDEIVIVK